MLTAEGCACASGAALGGVAVGVRRPGLGRLVAPDLFRQLRAFAVRVPDGRVGGALAAGAGAGDAGRRRYARAFPRQGDGRGTGGACLVRREPLGPESPGSACRIGAGPAREDSGAAGGRRAFVRPGGAGGGPAQVGRDSSWWTSGLSSVRCGVRKIRTRSRPYGVRCVPGRLPRPRRWRRSARG